MGDLLTDRPLAASDQPLLGVLLMLGFCAVIPLSDAIAKVLGQTIPLLQLLLVRFGTQAVLLVPGLSRGGGWAGFTPRVAWLTVARTAFQVIAVGGMFASLRFLPLAEAIAIAFVMPFILLMLGRIVLNEEVGPRRIAACAVGFAGTLLVIQPSFAEVGAPALLPVLVAFFIALYMLVTRQIAQEVDALVLQGTSGFLATVGLLLLLMLAPKADYPDLTLVMPDRKEALLLAGIGLLGTFAHLLMTWSLRFAPSATVAPIQYLEIPFATLLGWIVFSELPNAFAATGIFIIMAAGLYIVFRERKLAMPVPPEG